MAKHRACGCYLIHIGSGADILAPRQQHSLGGSAVNDFNNHYNNSAEFTAGHTPNTTCNAANTAAQLLQLQQLHCVVTRSSFFHINDFHNNYNVGCTKTLTSWVQEPLSQLQRQQPRQLFPQQHTWRVQLWEKIWLRTTLRTTLQKFSIELVAIVLSRSAMVVRHIRRIQRIHQMATEIDQLRRQLQDQSTT